MRGIKRTPDDLRFSLAIRERDGWRCQKCNEVYIPPTRALHTAHMFTRRTGATRLDPDNAMALCFGCHQYVDSHPEEKRKLWISRLGIDRYEALAARAHGKRDRLRRRTDEMDNNGGSHRRSSSDGSNGARRIET